jgi:hypothetical protein
MGHPRCHGNDPDQVGGQVAGPTQRCLVAIFLYLCFAGPALGGTAELPQPPCATGTIVPPKIERIRVWRQGALAGIWVPPSCLHWAGGETAFLVEIAGQGQMDGTSETPLHRLAAVSDLLELRYWSFSRKSWRRLFREAHALEQRSDASMNWRQRRDFRPEELKPGQDYFHWQRENNPGSGTVYRTRFHLIAPDHLIFTQSNETTRRLLWMTLLAPGDFEIYVEAWQPADGPWQFYSLARIVAEDQELSESVLASMVNRLMAQHRFLAGIPSGEEPPARR